MTERDEQGTPAGPIRPPVPPEWAPVPGWTSPVPPPPSPAWAPSSSASPEWAAPAPLPPPVPPPAGGPWQPPRRMEPVPGTPFAVAFLDVPRSTSGPSVGALATGIGSLLVMILVGCFGLIGAQAGSGALAGGAFGVLSGLLGGAGIGLGLVGLRQVRRLGVRGRGLAIAGIACGGSGVVLTLVILLALLLAG